MNMTQSRKGGAVRMKRAHPWLSGKNIIFFWHKHKLIYLAEYSTDCLRPGIKFIGKSRRMCLWTENIRRSFTISGHGVRGQRLSPMHLSLKIPIFVLLIFSLSSVHNRKTLLYFPMNLIPDRRQSVEYSARYLNFFVVKF